MEFPVYERSLDEKLTLCELILALNSERAAMREARLAPTLKWADIAAVDDEGNVLLWRDVPEEKRHLYERKSAPLNAA